MFKIVYLILFAGICLIDRSCLTQASKCVMKGICDTAAFGHVPCIYNGNPMAMTDSAARDVLKEICPELANEKALCCDSEQIIDLKNHAELFGVFLKVCPACYANYQHLLCQITCSPKQAEFVKILHHEAGEEKKEQVTEIDVFLNQDFADGFYKSCANISRFGEKVIDVFCKPWPADKCNSLRMLRYFGADFFHQGHSPYQIDYVLATDSHIKWNGEDHPVVKITPYKCSDSVNGKPKCACEHCPQSC